MREDMTCSARQHSNVDCLLALFWGVQDLASAITCVGSSLWIMGSVTCSPRCTCKMRNWDVLLADAFLCNFQLRIQGRDFFVVLKCNIFELMYAKTWT